MGMYTEMVLNCTVKGDTPADVLAVLRYMFNDDDRPDENPDHAFFRCDRWPMLGGCSSHYFIPFALSKIESPTYVRDHYLSTRSDLKNYDGEIDKFVDWVWPYVDASPGDFLGYKRYEEDDHPTLLYYGDTPTWVNVGAGR